MFRINAAWIFGFVCSLSSFALVRLDPWIPSLAVIMAGLILVTTSNRGRLFFSVHKADLPVMSLYLIFLAIPFVAYFLHNAKLIHQITNIFDLAFRLTYFLFLLFINRQCNRKKFWDGFLVPHIAGALLAVPIAIGWISNTGSLAKFAILQDNNASFVTVLAFMYWFKNKPNHDWRLIIPISFVFYLNWFVYRGNGIVIALAGAFLMYAALKRLIQKRVLAGALLVIFGIVIYQAISDPQFHFKKLFNNRPVIWRAYINFWKQSPWLGWGHTSQRLDVAVARTITDDSEWISRHDAAIGGVHNVYLFILWTKGIIGLSLFLGLIYFTFISRIRQRPAFNVILVLFSLLYGMTTQGGLGGLEFSANLLLVSLLVDCRPLETSYAVPPAAPIMQQKYLPTLHQCA